MKWPSPYRCAFTFSLAVLLWSGSSLAQNAKSPATPAAPAEAKAALRAYPRLAIGENRELEYVGLFASDGKYKPLTKMSRYVDSMVTASTEDKNKFEAPSPKPPHPKVAPRHLTVQDFQPPAHAVDVVENTSLLKDVRDSVINFVYGPESIFISPEEVITDSQQRVIVTDPDAHAIHVLDAKNKNSFSIVGGKGRRLQRPSGVAVDGQDNIYVSDYDLGAVLVYDSEGKFLRSIGSYQGESLYYGPAGIAIDRKMGRIYLLDQPRNLLFMLDLQGKELARFGKPVARDGVFASRQGSADGRGEFTNPSEIVIHKDELIVLDSDCRLQFFDLQGKFRTQFTLGSGKASGLAVDNQGTIYVSREATNMVEAYNHEGKLLSSFGRTGKRYGEFGSPAGLWADSSDRLYIVDADNVRLQLFQLHELKPSTSH